MPKIIYRMRNVEGQCVYDEYVVTGDAPEFCNYGLVHTPKEPIAVIH